MMQQLANGVDVLPSLLRLKQLGLQPQQTVFSTGDSALWGKAPQLRGMVLDLLRRTDGVELVEVTLLVVAPGKEAELPVLTDLPYEQYCVVLQGDNGAQVRQGELTALLRSTTIWWIGKSQAKVVNNTGIEFICLLVWIRQA